MITNTLLNSKVRRCQHIKADGLQCNLPAMNGHSICHRHKIVKRAVARPSHYDTPFIHVEDPASLQLAFNDVIARLLRGHIDRRDAALIIRSLRGIMAGLRMEHKAPVDPSTMVRNYAELAEHVDWNAHLTHEERERLQNQSDKSLNDRLRPIVERMEAEYRERQRLAAEREWEERGDQFVATHGYPPEGEANGVVSPTCS